MRRLLRGAASAALIALAAGAWAQAPKPERGTLARGEASFLEKAGEHGLAEVELGRLGQEPACARK